MSKKTKSRAVNAPPVKENASAKVLTNCTGSARGLTLSGGVIMLAPREMRELSDEEYDEVRALFHTETFQRFADNGYFSLSGIGDDAESVNPKTPEPPAGLSLALPVDALATPVSVAHEPRVVEHQTGGPVSNGG